MGRSSCWKNSASPTSSNIDEDALDLRAKLFVLDAVSLAACLLVGRGEALDGAGLYVEGTPRVNFVVLFPPSSSDLLSMFSTADIRHLGTSSLLELRSGHTNIRRNPRKTSKKRNI